MKKWYSVHIYYFQRRKNQFDYLPIAEDRSLSHKWNEEKRIQNIAERGKFKPSSFVPFSFFVKKKLIFFTSPSYIMHAFKKCLDSKWSKSLAYYLYNNNGIERMLGHPLK